MNKLTSLTVVILGCAAMIGCTVSPEFNSPQPAQVQHDRVIERQTPVFVPTPAPNPPTVIFDDGDR